MRRRSGTDADLVTRARAGDLEAFERLIARHRARALDIARQITHDRDAAQDVVQEALLRAFRSLAALRDGHRFGQWLRTIVRRQALTSVRDGDRRPQLLGEAMVWGLARGLWDTRPEEPSEVVERIRASLEVLSQRERTATILHYLEGRTCEEIARSLGVAVGTVKRVLYDSRRKVREECRAMREAERKPTGPKRLSYWMSGNVPHGRWDAMAHLKPALAQAVCLSVNKRAKPVAEIAADVESHPDYVSDIVEDLAELEVLASPKRSRYLLSFIALDGQDWRKLVSRIRQPAADISHRLAAAQERLRQAFERTPLAQSGWCWDDVVWAVNCEMLAHRGVFRAWNERPPYVLPARPGGFSYWIGGHESTPDVPLVDSTGMCGTDRGGWGIGHFGPSMNHEGYTWVFDPPSHGRTVMYALLDGPAAEKEVLNRLNAEDRERYRETLAKLVGAGLIERSGDGRYALAFPVFRKDDSDVLTPAVDETARPLVAEVLVPTWSDLHELLDEMGYGHCRDQYAVWQDWLFGFVMGDALRLMMKRGELPELGESPPAKWNFLAWKGDLSLMSLG